LRRPVIGDVDGVLVDHKSADDICDSDTARGKCWPTFRTPADPRLLRRTRQSESLPDELDRMGHLAAFDEYFQHVVYADSWPLVAGSFNNGDDRA